MTYLFANSRIFQAGNPGSTNSKPACPSAYRVLGRQLLLCLLASLLFPLTMQAATDGKTTVKAEPELVEIEGRIFTRQGALPEAVAVLFKDYSDIPDKPFLVSPPADAWGIFRISVPPGRYYFTAYGMVDDHEYRAFHGNNPVPIQRVSTRIGLMAMPLTKSVKTDGTGILRGVVTFKGKPLNKGYVTVYSPDAEMFKGLGLKSDSLNEKGEFDMKLPPGEYVVTAKKTTNKGSESGFGPPKHGDLIGYFLDNPIEITEEEDITLEVPTFPKGDRPSFDEVTKVEYLKTQFTSAFEVDTLATAGIKGRVTDVQGKPVKDLFALAYKTTEPVFQMFHLAHGTPFITWTDENGDFFIPLDEPGNYYVVARDTLGNAPHKDEMYGLYQGHPMHRVTFAPGQLLENIDIVAGITMDKDEKYQVSTAAPILLENFEYTGDFALKENTTWSGEIVINGVVSVPRGITLTLKPGTTVKFKKIDRDNNRIGDGEIMVEGKMLAEGEPGNKIVFTSAEKNPARSDWSYINIISTGAENTFRYCVFEHAFSGIQIHGSNIKVYDSLFWKSYEGLHFNTANLEASHNTMTQNGVGLKFSRLEGEVLISKNIMYDNDIGVQFTHQHINAVDFENLHKFLDMPVFVSNNFAGNKKYGFSMGELQSIDINVKDNWWGSVDPAKIETVIFDKHDDEELGEVQFASPLNAPVSDAGVRESGHN